MNEDISEKLFVLLHQCVNRMLRVHHAARHENMPEMHRGQGRLLMILSKEDGLTNGEICERMDIRPSSVNDLVSKLENAGYVTKQERENKRQVGYYLTEEGKEAVKNFSQNRMPVMRETFSALTDEEQVELKRLLEKLNASLKQKQDERPQEDIYAKYKFVHEHFPPHPPHPPHGGPERNRGAESGAGWNFRGEELTDEEQVELNRLLEKSNAPLKQQHDGRSQEDVCAEHKFAHEHFHPHLPLPPHGGPERNRGAESETGWNVRGEELTEEEQVELNRLLEKLNAPLKQEHDGRSQEDVRAEHKFAHEHFHPHLPLPPHGGPERNRKAECEERRIFQGEENLCAECDGARNCHGCPKKIR